MSSPDLKKEMEKVIYIVNQTEKSFFRYTMLYETDDGYKQILKELLTPPYIHELSHWSREDNIVIAPESCYHYLEVTYNELYGLSPETQKCQTCGK